MKSDRSPTADCHVSIEQSGATEENGEWGDATSWWNAAVLTSRVDGRWTANLQSSDGTVVDASNLEPRPAVPTRRDGDSPVVSVDNLVDDIESETCPLRLR